MKFASLVHSTYRNNVLTNNIRYTICAKPYKLQSTSTPDSSSTTAIITRAVALAGIQCAMKVGMNPINLKLNSSPRQPLHKYIGLKFDSLYYHHLLVEQLVQTKKNLH